MIAHGFIFARGGSKGLPRKNIMPLSGKPLICYSIETAKKVEILDKVFVSTDDAEIADIALAAGAIVIQRPQELAGDQSPEWLAWRHAIEWVTAKYGNFDEFVSLPATSPLRSVKDVKDAITKRSTTQADICISVTPASRSPFFNMVKIDCKGRVALVNKPDCTISRRQDAPTVFDMTTVVYSASPNFIMNYSNIFDGEITSIEVPKERAIDIDDIYDFKLAEVILNLTKGN
ncbi:acylneuraminate cytidylyltransferase family protein [Colwellia sp. TT2012]|uniref:acylneuraminate cytidylyltransferase family protein n=1 Tax=Colwellia sp. TT2012 TaxID=1720342 RepID=UPI0007107DA4|nr:acylneuraminate cytidylyltransferase family protein [Colwellia sp. TT2012]